MQFDVMTMEILWRRLITVTEEMAATICRTAFSPIVGLAADFSCEIVDVRGEGLAHSKATVPSFTYAMANAVRALIKKFPPSVMQQGDMYISNDPWLLAGHHSDIALLKPIFRKNKVVAFACSICHVTDIGGAIDRQIAQESYEEGVIFPIGHYYKAGEINSYLVDFFHQNIRFSDEVLGDLNSLVTANDIGEQRVQELMDQYNIDELTSLSDQILGRSEQAMRKSLESVPDGEYFSESNFDEFEFPMKVMCNVIIKGNEATIDLTGTSPQAPRGGINSTLSYTMSHCSYSLLSIFLPGVYANGGCYRPFKYIVPKGSLFNATFPASVWNRTNTGWLIHPCVHKSLLQILPERVMASQGMLSAGNAYARTEGKASSNSYYYVGGGMGATFKNDGHHSMLYPAGVRNISLEVFEQLVPCIVTEKGIRKNSGGPGKFRGGCGLYSTMIGHPNMDKKSKVQFAGGMLRKRIDPLGFKGGKPGKHSYAESNGKELTRKEFVATFGAFPLTPTQSLTMNSSGAGGYGPPWERDLESVQRDVLNEYVTIESARQDYGVILDPKSLEIDIAATNKERSDLKSKGHAEE